MAEYRPNHEIKEQRTSDWGVLNLKEDPDGSVWILGYRSLSRFNPPNEEYPKGFIKGDPTSRTPTDSTVDQNTKWEIFKDSSGYYYITGFGLSIYNEQTGKFRHFGPNYDNS